MSFDLSDVLDGVRHSRAFFLKHLEGLTPEQWAWKPYPECKSVREAVVHQLSNDRVALHSLQHGSGPASFEADPAAFYEGVATELARDTGEQLVEKLNAGHASLLGYIEQAYTHKPLDTGVALWGGSPRKLGGQVAYLSSEDHYHAGQIAFIRLATDPTWNYYAHIYG